MLNFVTFLWVVLTCQSCLNNIAPLNAYDDLKYLY